MNETVAVIGAGLGGLSAAIHLAAEGRRVTVYEKQHAPGGKASELRRDGFRFDTGPSLLTMPFVLDQLYDRAGADSSERVELLPVDPVCRYFFPDGTSLDAAADEEAFRVSVAAISREDGDAVTRFLDYSERIYDLTSDIFLFNSLRDLKSLLRLRHIKTLLRLRQIDPFRSVHEAVSSHFKDARIIQLFDRYATYNGSNPFEAPATLNIIPYVEYRLGGFYVRGGMYALVRSLTALAVRLGVDFKYGAEVASIAVRDGAVCGVELPDGLYRHAAVVSNADAVYTMTKLLPTPEKRRAHYDRLEPSCSGLVFLWGVRGEHPELAHHNIFFSRDYRREFDEIFTRMTPPTDPTVYVSITSHTDPDHAPEGHENWFVLVNMPALTNGNRNADLTAVRRAVLHRLRAAGLDIEARIVSETMISPSDLEQRYHANRGSIYGISSNSRNAAFLRPANNLRSIRGMYLCGGAAHPGGGVPLVLLSGMLAARELMARQPQ